MQTFTVKPSDRLVKDYYAALGQFGQLHIDHEMAVRSAFQAMLRGYSRKLDWTLVTEYSVPVAKGKRVVVDGALLDIWKFRHGFWEAKDEGDDLEREIKSKLDKGYPRSNIIFQSPERAILYQRGIRQGLNEDIRDPKNLSELLNEFFAYREPDHEEWDAAVEEFKQRIPELASGAEKIIEDERKSNRAFRESFESFFELCRQAINPNLSSQAVEKMLIQHLLTERIFRRVFHAEEFRNRNVIAAEIEKVIQSMTSRHFSRDAFLSQLDRFYKAIERAADDKDDYSEKQTFLNTVYERFFQGYDPKAADTHGIVYTPQPIVDFMVRSVEDILKKEFGKSLADKGVHILDPFVGTGNFIVRVMRQIAETRKSALPFKYANELHCNEVMLLPYYIASMNIEHEYAEHVGEYRPFEGICLVDTFELAEPEQQGFAFVSVENTKRVQKQKDSPIFVIIGNPPYNMGQTNENDNNRNRVYRELDRRVSDTYAKDSRASLKNKLSDPYVKAIRWASDRLTEGGIVAFVTNNSLLHQIAFDGMRSNLTRQFDHIYVVDLGGNVRQNPSISGTSHNVFGIQVGVSINIFVRKTVLPRPFAHEAEISYIRIDDQLRREDRLQFLRQHESVTQLRWQKLVLDSNNNWVSAEDDSDFDDLIPLGTKENKAGTYDFGTVFKSFSLGVASNRDEWVYAHTKAELVARVGRFIANYSQELARYRYESPASFIFNNDPRYIKWTDRLKDHLVKEGAVTFTPSAVRKALYRPFCERHLYFDHLLNQRRYQQYRIYPTEETERQNRSIVVSAIGSRSPFSVLMTNKIPELHLCASTDGFQCFPFFVYEPDGTGQLENMSDWVEDAFCAHFKDDSITKWDIFHYVYAVLHHPEYRERYAANLKRELPRIPYAPDFQAFAKAGAKLADLHVNYEKQPEYPLQRIENPKEKLSYRVEKMRLGKDKSSLCYNSFLTLSGIPPETYEYRLGNRSALEWVIDQYQVSTDKRSGITNDPNREDDEEYIVRLIGQVIYVSLETMKIVKGLPELGIAVTKGSNR